ncbi:MAG: hypothetical protein LUG16_02075, partial [Candidatus Gastranaerophilales bacterium]|nr:hypothetical protein [Candidatus Gastranaerophilales bacterium]
AMYYAKNIIINGLTSQFDIYQNNTKLAQIKLSIPGKHNIYNALAVFAALKEANVNMDSVYKHFETFSGMGRRFQKVCEFNGIKVYDDYAHHPSEIKTTLISLKNSLNPQERAVAVFQPHRYTRLKGLWEEFKKAFEYTDKLFITDIYSAGEDKIEGITSENFSKDLKNTDNTYISGTIEDCAKKIYPLLKKNDIVITLGAGTITKLGKLLEKESEKVH